MSASETFPDNYFATEVAAPGNEPVHQPELTRISHESDETVHSGQDYDRRLALFSVREEIVESTKRGLPKAKPSRYEKYMGKLEKIAGTYWNNPYLVEKGELRQSGMLAARRSQNRA